MSKRPTAPSKENKDCRPSVPKRRHIQAGRGLSHATILPTHPKVRNNILPLFPSAFVKLLIHFMHEIF